MVPFKKVPKVPRSWPKPSASSQQPIVIFEVQKLRNGANASQYDPPPGLTVTLEILSFSNGKEIQRPNRLCADRYRPYALALGKLRGLI